MGSNIHDFGPGRNENPPGLIETTGSVVERRLASEQEGQETAALSPNQSSAVNHILIEF